MQDDLIAVTQADHGRAAEIMRLFVLCGTRMDGREDYQTLLRQLAAHRQQAEDAMRELHGDMLRKAIEDGYPLPAHKADQCAHGNFGWEDCIACYDEQLLNTEAAIRATPPKPDRLNGEGE